MQDLVASRTLGDLAQARDEGLAAHGAFDEDDRPRGGGEPASLGAVGGEDGVNGVRRQCLGEFGARGTVTLARALDIATTAEGVETELQLELLRAAGVTLAQGYLFSRPVPAPELGFARPDVDARPTAAA